MAASEKKKRNQTLSNIKKQGTGTPSGSPRYDSGIRKGTTASQTAAPARTAVPAQEDIFDRALREMGTRREDTNVFTIGSIGGNVQGSLYNRGQSYGADVTGGLGNARQGLLGTRDYITSGQFWDDPVLQSLILQTYGENADRETVTADLLGAMDQEIAYADYVDLQARARSGDREVFQGAGERADEAERLYRLSGYDAATERFGEELDPKRQRPGFDLPEDNTDPVYEQMSGGVRTYNDMMQIHSLYPTDALRDDLYYIASYVSGQNDVPADDPELRAAIDRASGYTGFDVLTRMQQVGNGARHYGSTSAEQRTDAVNAVADQILAEYDEEHAFLASYYNQAVAENGLTPEQRVQLAASGFDPAAEGTDAFDQYMTYLEKAQLQQSETERIQQQVADVRAELVDKWSPAGVERGYAYDPQMWSGYEEVPNAWQSMFSGGVNSQPEMVKAAILAIHDEDLAERLIDEYGDNGRPPQVMERYNATTITQQDQNMFMHLWDTQGPEKAMQYLDDISMLVDMGVTFETERANAELADSGVGGALLAAGADLASVYGRAMALPYNLARTMRGEEISEYDAAFLPGRASGAVRGTIGQNLDEALGGANILGWNVGSGVFNAGMSAIESWMMAPLGAHAGALFLGSVAGNDAMRTALENGRSTRDAAIDGFVAAGIETGFEYASLEKLFADTSNPWRYLLTNATTESLEELGTQAATIAYDTMRYGDTSDLGKLYASLLAMGYEKDAALEVTRDVAGQLWDAWAGGFVGGTLGSGTGAVTTAYTDRATGRNIMQAGNVQGVLDLARTMNLPPDVQAMVDNQWRAAQAQSNAQARAMTQQGRNAAAEAEQQPGMEQAMEEAETSQEVADAAVEAVEEQQTQEQTEAPEISARPMTGMQQAMEAASTQEVSDQIAMQTRQAIDEIGADTERTLAEMDQEWLDYLNGRQEADIEAEAITPEVQETEQETETQPTETVQQAAEQQVETTETTEQAETTEESGKTPKVSAAKMGRIYRAMMQQLDTDAQNVLTESMSSYVSRVLQENGYDGDRVNAQVMADKILRISAGQAIDPRALTDVTTNDAAMRTLNSLTARIDEVNRIEGVKKQVAAMAQAPEGKAQQTAAEVVDEPEEQTATEQQQAQAEEIARTEQMTQQQRQEYVQQQAQEYGANAEAVAGMYNESQNPAAFAQQYRTAYQYGQDGRNLSIVEKSDTLAGLTQQQIRHAYTLGQAARRTAQQQPAQAAGSAGNVDTSAIKGRRLNAAQGATVQFMTDLAKAGGFNVRFVATSANAQGRFTEENGSYNPKTRTVTIDINAGRLSTRSFNYAMVSTAGHELTHFMKQFGDAQLYNAYQEFVFDHLSQKMSEAELNEKIDRIIEANKALNKELSREQAIDEIVADASGDVLQRMTESDIQELAEQNPGLLKRIKQFLQKWVHSMKNVLKIASSGQKVSNELAKQMEDVIDEQYAKWMEMFKNAAENARRMDAEADGTVPDQAVDVEGEIQFSLRYDGQLMDRAEAYNNTHELVDPADMAKARADRERVADFMNDDSRTLNLPPDVMGNTAISNSSYGGVTEENTTICPRSIGADAFLDAVSEYLGRPLTVAEQVRISQDIIGAANIKDPQCIYCYVAADRAAYREFLGKYIEQRDMVVDALKNGETNTKALYERFLNGRKDTDNMKARFNLWVNTYKSGQRMLSASDLANIGVLTAMQSDKYRQLSDKNFAAQMKDALAYAQSASWAKKRVNYIAYNGHILKWPQKRINDLNGMYGLRMYSFSDFSPAFALENMQMVTDAAARGLKVLAYTKVPAFAEIFADTGMNINVSVFATEVRGDNGNSIVENNLMGADWATAQRLRSEHENIGITFVATNDAQVEWALAQEWVDVVIPYHLVRTGRTIAEIMKYKDFTGESADTKKKSWSKEAGNLSSIPAALHNNDKATYMRLLEENNLESRFARFVDNPNYMKLVNETRQSVTTSQPVQPIFNADAAINALQDMANNGGYYVPIGGSEQRMYELADEFAGKVRAGEYADTQSSDDVQFSVRDYSYAELTAKPDMPITQLTHSSISRDDAGIIGRANVEKYAVRHDANNAPLMYVPDLGRYVTVGRQALEHGLGRNASTQGLVVAQIGDILKNSIVVNEATPKKSGVKNTWLLLGVAESQTHNLVYVRIVVNQSTGHVDEITSMYAALGKEQKNKTGRSFAPQASANSIGLPTSSTISISDLLAGVNGLFDDIISADVAKHLGIARSQSEFSGRLLFQTRDPSTITDRDILADAMETLAQNPKERGWASIYRKHIEELEQKQAQLDASAAKLAELRKNPKQNRDEIIREQNRQKTLAAQIDREDSTLLKYEAAAPVREYVKRQRAEIRQAAEQRVREHYQQKLAEAKQEKAAAVKKVRDEKNESAARSKYLDRIGKDASTLREWLTHPTNKAHVPEFLRKPLGEFMESLDFSSKRSLSGGAQTQADQRMLNAMRDLHEALSKSHGMSAAEFGGYVDLTGNFLEQFTELRNDIERAMQGETAKLQELRDRLAVTKDPAKRAELEARIKGYETSLGTPVNLMTSQQLRALSEMITTLNTSIRKMNTALGSARQLTISGMSKNTIDNVDKLGQRKAQFEGIGAVDDFWNWNNTTPIYVFKRFGAGGQAIFEELQDGWDKLAMLADKVVKFTEDTYKSEEVAAWNKQIHEFNLNGQTVRMTATQLMSLYCLNRRDQGRQHLLGGGVRVAEMKSKGKTVSDAADHMLNEAMLDEMLSKLTKRQIEVADALQAYMSNECAKLGNEISMKRFGYEMFTESMYFPIEVDKNNLRRINEEQTMGQSIFRLLNLSSTKPLQQGANNALVLRDIFDVFASHTSDMAKYNALALPVLDMIKWYNYVEKLNSNGEPYNPETDSGQAYQTRSVQKSLEGAFGNAARRYVENFLKDLNGDTEGGREDGMFNRLISRYKVASVAANLRVGMLQITSLPRAAYAINPKYLFSGIAKWNTSRGKISKTARDKVGIAKWKSLGFYDTSISRNMRELIKHDESTIDKVRQGSMKLAELGDSWTMGVLYGAVEAEMRDKHKELKPGSEEYNRQVNARMREIVYQTQVVDSTMTRSQFMRSKGFATLATAFMSEPTLAMNMMNDSIFEARMKSRAGEKWSPLIYTKVSRALGVWMVTSAISAAVEALFSAMRDDDEFESFWEKYSDALLGDYDDAESFGDRWTAFWAGSFGGNLNPFDDIPILKDFISAYKGETSAPMWAAAFGELGDGVNRLITVIRDGGSPAEIYGAIYKLVGGMSKSTGIAASNAMRDIVSVYNTFLADRMGWRRVQTYDDSEGKAADAMIEAMIAGDEEAIEKAYERAGIYDMDPDKIADALAKRIDEAYVSGQIDRSTADRLLTEYGGKRARDAEDMLTEADYERATGHEHGKMKSDYLSGLLTEEEVREYLTEYDGMREGEIEERLGEWNYERDTGYVYSQMKADYIDGELTEEQVMEYRMEYGGAEEGDVTTLLGKWNYERDTGLAWSDMRLDYADGVISESELRTYLSKYGGKDEEQIEETVSNYDYQIATGRTTTAPKYWRIAYAYESGGDYEAYIDEAFNQIMYGGDKRKTWKQARSSIASSVASYYKKTYLAVAGTPEGDQMLERILDVYEAIGYNRSEQRRYIAENWFEA